MVKNSKSYKVLCFIEAVAIFAAVSAMCAELLSMAGWLDDGNYTDISLSAFVCAIVAGLGRIQMRVSDLEKNHEQE